jgi:hypothetical protein
MFTKKLASSRLAVEVLEDRTVPTSPDALGEKGINMEPGYTGAGITVGMVEPYRPGRQGVDAVFHPGVSFDPNLMLTTTWDRDKPATNAPGFIERRGGHATQMASVMVGKFPADTLNKGAVANAKLYSSAMSLIINPDPAVIKRLEELSKAGNMAAFNAAIDEENSHANALSFKTITKANNGDMPIINASVGTNAVAPLNGSHLDTLMLDYFASAEDSLFFVSNDNEDKNMVVFPSSYNSLAISSLQNKGGSYSVIANFPSPTPDRTRSRVQLVAPGVEIPVAMFINNKADYGEQKGNSIATALTSSAGVALVQYIRHNAQAVQLEAQKNYVLKAILINSADKLIGQLPDPGGKNAMARNIFANGTWLNYGDVIDERSKDAAVNKTRQENALNFDFGAGGVNVARAVAQVKGGRLGVPANAPAGTLPGPLGWDAGSVQGGAKQSYSLPDLKAGEYLSATLTWERPVQMKDGKGNVTNAAYQRGFTFDGGAFATKPPDLNLYLMPKGSQNLADAVWASISPDSNVEHFFFKLPNKGDAAYSKNGYELVVVSKEAQGTVPYGIAWWGVKPGPAEGDTKKLSGLVWEEGGVANGLREQNEPLRSNVEVSLRNANGVAIDRTTTDWEGRYEFYVEPGTYAIKFEAPHAREFTLQNVGTDDAIDSDANAAGFINGIVVSAADVDHLDAGLVTLPYGSVSGFTWEDLNADGIQDEDELGRAGVEVTLYTQYGDYVDSTVTDEYGLYLFESVGPGHYFVGFSRPVNDAFTLRDVGSDELDSDAHPETGLSSLFTLTMATHADIDAGFVPTLASVGDRVWLDANADGIQDEDEPGVEGQLVRIFDSLGTEVAETVTDGGGNYQFDGLEPGTYTVEFTIDRWFEFTAGGPTQTVTLSAGEVDLTVDAGVQFDPTPSSISGRAWVDKPYEDGLQQPSESPVEGVEMQLIDDTTQNVVDVTTTGDGGRYKFEWVVPGTYRVRVMTQMGITLKDVGSDDTIDSDFHQTTKLTDPIAVPDGQDVPFTDVGLLPGIPVPGTVQSIGDFVWFDTNQNGIQEAGEPGLDGIEVQLFDLANTLIATTTSSGGSYSFPLVPAGIYRARFILPPSEGEEVVFEFTHPYRGSNHHLDSNVVDADGYTDWFFAGGEDRLDIDAGVIQVAVLT